MILIVEDSQFMARTLQAQFAKYVPEAEVVFVADGEDAVKALTKEEFEAYDPKTAQVKRRGSCDFTAVIWDNHLPEILGDVAKSNVGLRTVEALQLCRKVDRAVLSHFISHSGDDSAPFIESGRFVRVYKKPMTVSQVQEVGELFNKWSVSSRGSEDEHEMDLVEAGSRQLSIYPEDETDPRQNAGIHLT